jgi:glycine/D-amino acid oxidase-like deaminating enzyme
LPGSEPAHVPCPGELPVPADSRPLDQVAPAVTPWRLDGGWTVATSAANIADVPPDSIRFFPKFLPAYLVERDSLKMRFG